MDLEEQLYNEKYGHLPFDRKELLDYIRSNYKINMDKVEEQAQRIKSIPWREMEIVLPVVPKPSPRPRYSSVTKSFYVKGAAKNKKLIKKYIKDADIIFTRTELYVTTYQPIPISIISKDELYLAEMGLVRPTQNPDWDNLGKTYCDMIQGLLLLNDNIVTTGLVDKFFSIKPRVIIKIRWQADFDSKYNKKKITTSTSYIKHFGKEINLPCTSQN